MNYLHFIIGIFCLFGSGRCALLGAKECTFGPSYWCESISNAKQCNAVKHCIQTVWENQVLPEDNDDICSICKDMVKDARDQLLSNETQEEIREVFEGSCKLIPVVIIKDECIKLSDEFIPELIDTLASQMDPQIVCATAGLCNSPRVDRMLKQYMLEHPDYASLAKPQDKRFCSDCTKFVSDVKTEVQTHSRAEVLDHLLAICARVGSLSDGCMALIQTHFEVIYQFLSDQMRPQDLCDLFGMCVRLYGTQTVDYPRTEDEPCDFCVAIVNGWRNNLIANTTREEFKQILEGICAHTGSFSSECLSLTDQYFEVLYDVLISEIRPKQICEAFGLCGPNSIFNTKVPLWTVMQPQDHLPLVPLHPSFDTNELIGQDEANSYRHNIKLPRVSLSKSDVQVVSIGENGRLETDKSGLQKGDYCIMCEFVLHFLQNVLQDKKSREEIKEAVDGVCNLLPHTLTEQCRDYVDAYGDQLMQLIVLEIDPSTICPMLKLCPEVHPRLLAALPKTNFSCVLCEYVMTELDEILEDQKKEDEIKKALESVCSAMPKPVSKECNQFIDTYFDMIVFLIIDYYSPKELCAQLGLCSSNSQKPASLSDVKPEESQLPVSRFFSPDLFETDRKKVVSIGEKGRLETDESGLQKGDYCIMCEFVLHFLQNVLQDKKSREEIKEAVDNVCNLMPHTLAEQCQDYVDAYGDQLIQLIILEIDPSTICPMLKLCPEAHPRLLAALPKTEFSCVLCEYVMTELDETLQDKKKEDEIKKAVESVCSAMPKSVRKKCTQFIDNYFDLIVDLIVNGYSPRQICAQLGLCSSNSQKLASLSDVKPDESQLPVSRFFSPDLFETDRKKTDDSKSSVEDQSVSCVICEFVMMQIDTLLLKNSTEKDIEKAIDRVCMMMPSTLMNTCLDFMEEYGDSIIEMLVNSLEPDNVCRSLKLCKDTFHNYMPKADVPFPEDKCEVCKEVTGWVDNNIEKSEDYSRDSQIIIDHVCRLLPGNVREMCVNMVWKYGQFLKKLLVKLNDSQRVCEAIKMCDEPLLGAEKCTWGPSYWCKSPHHAKSCNATQHCVDNVWGGKVPEV